VPTRAPCGKTGLANYTLVINLGGMGVTTVWWSCAECGSYAELPADETVGFEIGCPDCPGAMSEQWEWDAA
jgi:hypothetical protein